MELHTNYILKDVPILMLRTILCTSIQPKVEYPCEFPNNNCFLFLYFIFLFIILIFIFVNKLNVFCREVKLYVHTEIKDA